MQPWDSCNPHDSLWSATKPLGLTLKINHKAKLPAKSNEAGWWLRVKCSPSASCPSCDRRRQRQVSADSPETRKTSETETHHCCLWCPLCCYQGDLCPPMISVFSSLWNQLSLSLPQDTPLGPSFPSLPHTVMPKPLCHLESNLKLPNQVGKTLTG